MKTRSIKLYDVKFENQWFEEVLDKWDYDDLLKDQSWRKGWISLDCSCYSKDDDRVYLGITSFDADDDAG